jgi:hypothetical protein
VRLAAAVELEVAAMVEGDTSRIGVTKRNEFRV